FSSVARKAILDIGYCGGDSGYDGASCGVMVALGKQSPDIAMGVNVTSDHEQGAGDQGMMFGYACNETPNLMPLPINLAYQLGLQLSKLRKEKVLPWLQPDGKTQVTVEYQDGKPVCIDTIVVSNQHSASVSNEEIRKSVIEQVVRPTIPQDYVKRD